MELMLFKSY